MFETGILVIFKCLKIIAIQWQNIDIKRLSTETCLFNPEY